MRSLDAVNQDVAEARKRRDVISDDLWRIEQTAGEKPNAGQQERRDALFAGLQTVGDEIESLEDEWRSAIQAGLADGTLSTDPAWPEDRDRRGTSTVDGGDPRFRQVRSRALATIERHQEFSTDEATNRLDRVVRR